MANLILYGLWINLFVSVLLVCWGGGGARGRIVSDADLASSVSISFSFWLEVVDLAAFVLILLFVTVSSSCVCPSVVWMFRQRPRWRRSLMAFLRHRWVFLAVVPDILYMRSLLQSFWFGFFLIFVFLLLFCVEQSLSSVKCCIWGVCRYLIASYSNVPDEQMVWFGMW